MNDVEQFIALHCFRDEGAACFRDELYDAYVRNGGTLSAIQFGRALGASDGGRHGQRRRWKGIGLTAELPTPEQVPEHVPEPTPRPEPEPDLRSSLPEPLPTPLPTAQAPKVHLPVESPPTPTVDAHAAQRARIARTGVLSDAEQARFWALTSILLNAHDRRSPEQKALDLAEWQALDGRPSPRRDHAPPLQAPQRNFWE